MLRKPIFIENEINFHKIPSQNRVKTTFSRISFCFLEIQDINRKVKKYLEKWKVPLNLDM